MEEGVGYRYKEVSRTEEINDQEMKSCVHVQAREGDWQICTEDSIGDNKIIRKASLECFEDSIFMDFVVRMRFKKIFFDHAEIAGKKIVHEQKNVYHQFPVKNAHLIGSSFSVDINILDASCGEKFKPHLYVRDHGDEWVVHARMIPVTSDKDVLKLCSRYFSTSPLPQMVASPVLAFPAVKNYLWYRGEHSPYRSKLGRFFNLNAFPMVRLKKGEKLFWSVEIKINGQ